MLPVKKSNPGDGTVLTNRLLLDANQNQQQTATVYEDDLRSHF